LIIALSTVAKSSFLLRKSNGYARKRDPGWDSTGQPEFAATTFDAEREVLVVAGLFLHAYSSERTIIDWFRLAPSFTVEIFPRFGPKTAQNVGISRQ